MTTELPGLLPFRWEANDGPITPRQPEDDVEFGAAGAIAAGTRTGERVARSGRGPSVRIVELEPLHRCSDVLTGKVSRLSRQTLSFVSGLVRAHRREIGSSWRALDPGQQALLVLVYLRKGEPFTEVGAGFGVSTPHRTRRQ
jgi:hypothetical protein